MVSVLWMLLIPIGSLIPLGSSIPNQQLTPGAVRNFSVVQICSIRWGKDVRHVSSSLKLRVYKAYGIQNHFGYVVDHLIPRELGGGDVFANLWPQTKQEADVKDITENLLHREVCAGTISLTVAQEQMRLWGRN